MASSMPLSSSGSRGRSKQKKASPLLLFAIITICTVAFFLKRLLLVGLDVNCASNSAEDAAKVSSSINTMAFARVDDRTIPQQQHTHIVVEKLGQPPALTEQRGTAATDPSVPAALETNGSSGKPKQYRRRRPPQEPWAFEYYGPDSEIQSYDPSQHPVLSSVKNTKVRLFTDVFATKPEPINECKQILYDGLNWSSVLDFQDITYTMKNKVRKNGFHESWKDDELWVLDSHHVIASCDRIVDMTRQTLELKQNQTWTILAIDYGDDSDALAHCPEVEATIGPANYRLAKRSLGINRTWSEEDQFPTKGRIMPQPRRGSEHENRPVLHMPYPVRTDLATVMADQIRNFTSPLDEAIIRDIDVSHFYQRQNKNYAKVAYYDNLRNGVNVVLRFLNGSSIPDASGGQDRPLITFAGLVGVDRNSGRNEVFPEYASILLRSKIIVVAQRDGWSDHYRLMEALSAGAMVLCDETLVLPRGLRPDESVVVFTSFAHLREQLEYYAVQEEERREIAARGWNIAMGYHRSWHAMESLIFGRAVTNVGDAIASFQQDVANQANIVPPKRRRRRPKEA